MGADYNTDQLRGRLSVVSVVEALGLSYFCNGHIPGAVNIPPHRVSELAATLLPEKGVPIVVYGADKDSPGADVVARQLALLGYLDVSRYVDRKAGWAEAWSPLIGDAEE